jgi:hypothetical protein
VTGELPFLTLVIHRYLHETLSRSSNLPEAMVMEQFLTHPSFQYASLNSTQCNIGYHTMSFNATVDIVTRNITVIENRYWDVIPDIEPTGFLTWLTTWQFQMMASDQTSLYSSLIGNSFNTSINNYMVAMTPPETLEVTPAEAVLSGLSNSISAMVDDMLVSYASAQLMVANDTQTAPVTITIKALQLGEREYTIIVVILNTILILLVVEEALRTRGWRELTDFNYMNPRNLLVESSRVVENLRRLWILFAVWRRILGI